MKIHSRHHKNITDTRGSRSVSNGMEQSIRNFARQFAWKPEVAFGRRPSKKTSVIICGLGGSHLAADLLPLFKPSFLVTVWSDYGLPPLPKSELKKSLVILSSYSGNTEETINAFRVAGKVGASRAAITSGGKLIALARRENVSTVVMPNWGLQPRATLGLGIRALFKILGEQELLRESASLSKSLTPERFEPAGKTLAKLLRGKIPVVYSSLRNQPIAYNWKIKFNETGKIPAFWNVLPELNHNEMTGFDVRPKNRALSHNFYFLLLTDADDNPRIQKRMRILARLYRARGLPVKEIPLRGKDKFSKVFSSLILADWAALATARFYGANPTEVPMVEEFKRLIASAP